MLVLFDIDGTLLRADGVGRHAMERAGRELFHGEFTCEGVSFAGSLDPLIWRDLCARNGLESCDGEHRAFRERYARHLEVGLRERPPRALDGVPELVAALEGRGGWTVGILSGNWPETGRIKLAAAGLAPERFPVQAWGDDGARRGDLVPAALARYARHAGGSALAARVVVVGDTPADVACGREHGCRTLAVATGWSARAELERAGADRVVDDLRGTRELVEWLTAAGAEAG